MKKRKLIIKKESKIFNTFRFLCLSLMFVLGLVAIIGTGGCGGSSSGGGGGGGEGAGGSTSLTTGEFTKTVTLASADNWNGPFFTTDQHQQQLYLASDINGAGYIYSIELRLNLDTTGSSCPDATIKMGHTSLGGLTTTFSNNVEEGKGTLETVRTGAFNVPAGSAGDYFTIILDTPFLYNGVDNLVVDFLITACNEIVNLRVDNTTLANGALHINSLTSPTGTLYTSTLHTNFNFEGGDNPLFNNPTFSATVPFNVNPDVQRQQQLYLASDINGSGPITGLGIQVGNLTTEETYTVSVTLGHATVTTLSFDYAANYSGSPVTAANSVSFTIPANVPANSYVWIPLPDAVFTYNGTDNLILEFDVTAATGDTLFTYHDHGSGDVRLIYGTSDASLINLVASAIHHIKLRFNGGTMDVITAEDIGLSVPFSNLHDYKMQFMFGAQQLGTGGPVTGISFRLVNNSLASDYPAATVVLGHTANPVLSMTFADNMTDPTTVFTGTLNIPARLKAGDWVTIPVSGFTYDPTQNLVVEVIQDAGTASNSILSTNVDVPGDSGMVLGDKMDLMAFESSPGQSDIRVHLGK